MSIQSLSSNNANILQPVGQLLTELTPMLLQAMQQAPLSPISCSTRTGKARAVTERSAPPAC